MPNRKILNITFALIIVVSALVGSTGTAVAVHGGDCSELDEFFWVLSIGTVNADKCDSSHLSDSYQELEEAKENSTKTQIYNTGSQLKTTREAYLANQNNYLLDSGTVAMTKAESAAISAIDANKSRSEVKADAQEAVRNHYALMQMNLVDRFNTDILTIWTMKNTSNIAGIENTFVDGDETQAGSSWVDASIIGQSQTQVSLVNGSTVLIYGLDMRTENEVGGTFTDTVIITNEEIDNTPLVDIEVEPISGETSYYVMDWSEMRNAYNDINSKSTQMEANAETYADGLYNASQNETLDASDYISPSTLAEQYSTNFNDTGYYAYAVGYAGANGFAIPKINSTDLMTITTGSGTYNGLIMSQYAPDGGVWETGVTYNANNIQGKQLIATSDGELIELQDTFTIESMQDKDGNEVQTTEVRQIEYDVSNASESYAELQENIRALQLEINSLDPMGTGGDTGDSNSNSGIELPNWLTMNIAGIPVWLIGIAALVIGYLFISRR